MLLKQLNSFPIYLDKTERNFSNCFPGDYRLKLDEYRTELTVSIYLYVFFFAYSELIKRALPQASQLSLYFCWKYENKLCCTCYLLPGTC